ncbi:MAG: InlB B-repeat-containing protein [Acholeplasmatales bacterium]
MKKRILLVVLLLVGLFFVASCDKKEPVKETFALTLPAGITSNQEDNAKILKDTNVVITITVPEGKEIDSLKVDGVEKKAEVVSNKLSFKMTKNITVTVSFKDQQPAEVFYALTLPTGVTSDQTNNAKILKDTNVVLTIVVPEGQMLASLKVDGVEKKADVVSNKLTVKMTKDITVTVAFEDIPPVVYALTLPEGVTSDQADNSVILINTDVVLTIAVPEGKKLGSLKVDGVEKKADVVGNKLTIKMTKDITVTVAFEDIVYALTLPAGVTSDQADNSAIVINTDVVLTIAAPEGKKLASLKVDGVEKKEDVVGNKLTIKMTKDITVTVTFEDIVYALTLPEGVTSNQTDNSAIVVNTDVVLTVAVAEGKAVESLKVDGVEKVSELSTEYKYTVKMTKDITVTVSFKDLVPELTGILYHWMIGAISDKTGLKANIDLFGATYDDITGEGLTVKIGDTTLDYIIRL